MKIFNDFKKLWIDKKGIIEGKIEVEITNIMPRKDDLSSVAVKIYVKDDEDAKLMTFGPWELSKGDTMILKGLKVSIEVNLSSDRS